MSGQIGKAVNLNALGPALMRKAVSLTSAGLSGVGWRRADFASAVQEARALHWVVLGGDVCVLDQGKIRHVGDNWYIEVTDTQDIAALIEAGADRALGYVRSYPETPDELVIVPVFTCMNDPK